MISRKESLIIAIGGGGCNVAATVKAQGIESARFVFLDTEPDDLGNHSGAGEAVLLQGTEAELLETINRLFVSDVDKVVIMTCLGGNTGSRFAQVAIRLAKAAGKNPACIVTRPFDFEGGGCKKLAESALAEIRTYVSEVYVIDKNDLKTKYPDMNLLDAFSKVDEQVAEVLQNMLV